MGKDVCLLPETSNLPLGRQRFQCRGDAAYHGTAEETPARTGVTRSRVFCAVSSSAVLHALESWFFHHNSDWSHVRVR